MTDVRLLYDKNRMFVDKQMNMPVHLSEICDNISSQAGNLDRRNKPIHIPLAIGFFVASGVCAYAGLNAILEALRFLSSLESFDLFQIARGMGVIGIGLFCLVVAYIFLRGSLSTRSFVSTEEAAKVAENLLASYQIAIGEVLNVMDGKEKTLHFTYQDTSLRTITGEFETRSDASISVGDRIYVIYNADFSIVL